MFRAFIYLLAAILIITVLRSVIGIIARGASELLSGDDDSARQPRSASSAGELKRDPVCGTYVAEAASIKRSAGGQVYHFCSPECRDRFKG